jgi:hypothetical protein
MSVNGFTFILAIFPVIYCIWLIIIIIIIIITITRRSLVAWSRKVPDSIPDELMGFFSWPNPPSNNMAQRSTQPLVEMSSSRGTDKPHRHLWADYLENVGASTSHNPMGLHGLL